MRAGIRRIGLLARISDTLWHRPRVLLLVLLLPPALWLVIFILVNLGVLFLYTFFSADHSTSHVDFTLTLATYKEVLHAGNLNIIWRTLVMAIAVTIGALILAFPIAYYAARYARGIWKTFFFIGVMLPLFTGYVIKAYALNLMLGPDSAFYTIGQALRGLFSPYFEIIPHQDQPFLISPIRTFLILVYVALPFMVLPIQIVLSKVPKSLFEVSGDLGAHPSQTFWHVTFPLAIPGIFVGALFTLSLVLGDYIVPFVLNSSHIYTGQVIYFYQGISGDLPHAAIFSFVPFLVMGIYVWVQLRRGRFNAV